LKTGAIELKSMQAPQLLVQNEIGHMISSSHGGKVLLPPPGAPRFTVSSLGLQTKKSWENSGGWGFTQ
jgi:hypothetical protein